MLRVIPEIGLRPDELCFQPLPCRRHHPLVWWEKIPTNYEVCQSVIWLFWVQSLPLGALDGMLSLFVVSRDPMVKEVTVVTYVPPPGWILRIHGAAKRFW